MKAFTLSSAVLVATLASVSAPQAEAAGTINPWQHCGIGAIIFPNHGIVAAISNITWDLGTTAVISATLSEETCGTELFRTGQFINENYEQIETELAIGEGKHLNTMLSMMGSDEKDHAQLIQQVRQNHEIMAHKPNHEKAEALFLHVQGLLLQS